MFAWQTWDLYHIEFSIFENISSLNLVKAYRVNTVDISTYKNEDGPWNPQSSFFASGNPMYSALAFYLLFFVIFVDLISRHRTVPCLQIFVYNCIKKFFVTFKIRKISVNFIIICSINKVHRLHE